MRPNHSSDESRGLVSYQASQLIPNPYHISRQATEFKVIQNRKAEALAVLLGGQAILVVEVAVAAADNAQAELVVVVGCQKIAQRCGQDFHVAGVNPVATFQVGGQKGHEGLGQWKPLTSQILDIGGLDGQLVLVSQIITELADEGFGVAGQANVENGENHGNHLSCFLHYIKHDQ